MSRIHLRSKSFFARAQDVSGMVGWTKTGTIVHLTVATDTVAIGAATMSGTEKVRIVGGLRLDDAVNDLAYIEMTDGQSAAVSNANEGRFRYDESVNQFQVSVNGGAYVDILTAGGWTDTGAVVRLTNVADTVAIGAAAMSGAEKVRIVGDLQVEGSINIPDGATAPAAAGSLRLTGGSTATGIGIKGPVSGTDAFLYINGSDEVSLTDIGGATRVKVGSPGNVHLFPVQYVQLVGNLYFGPGTIAPQITQLQHSTGNAQNLLVRAQQGAAGFNGGNLNLRAGPSGGGGGTDGQLNLLDGGGNNRFYLTSGGNVTASPATAFTVNAPLLIPDGANDYIRFGLAPGSGAGSGASVGLIRTDTVSGPIMVARQAGDGGDRWFITRNADAQITFGHLSSWSDVFLKGVTVGIGPATELTVDGSVVTSTVPMRFPNYATDYIGFGNAPASGGTAEIASSGNLRFNRANAVMMACRAGGGGSDYTVLQRSSVTLTVGSNLGWSNTYLRAATNVYLSAGGANSVQVTSSAMTVNLPILVPDAANDYIRFGLAPGSGAGSGAATGLIRSDTTNQVLWAARQAGDAGDRNIIERVGDTSLIFGNVGDWTYGYLRANTVFVGPNGSSQIEINTNRSKFTSGQIWNTRTVTATPDAPTLADHILLMDLSTIGGAATVNLPAAVTGEMLVISDYQGASAASNITVNANGAETIDGAASVTVNVNYTNLILMGITGTGWKVF